MNSKLVHPIILTLLLSGSVQIARAEPSQAGRGSAEGPRHRSHRADLESTADRVDALFAPWSQNQMPGAAVLVVQGGQVVHKKGYGLADIKSKTPIRPDTSFLLGSATKSFTALSIMILADQHKLAYRDSLSTFFPEFPRYAKEITVADLLHHTAGLPEYGKVLIDMGLIDEDWPRSIDSRAFVLRTDFTGCRPHSSPAARASVLSW